MGLLGLAFAFILPFSCNDNLTDFELQNGETKSNTNFATPSMSENDIKLKAEAIRNDTLFKQLVYNLFDNSFVVKSIDNGSIPLSKWNELNAYLLSKNPQDTISLNDLEFFLGDQSDAFYNQVNNINSLFFNLIAKYFSYSTPIEDVKVVLSEAFKPQISNSNTYAIGCCAACEGEYKQCLVHAKEDGGIAYVGIMIVGIAGSIFSLNPAPALAAETGGALVGALVYANKSKQCGDKYESCKDKCPGNCD